MEIGLWSNNENGIGVTTLTAIMAAYGSVKYNLKTMMSHELFSDLSMENYVQTDEERQIYNQLGEMNVEHVMRLINNGKLMQNQISDYCYALLPHSALDFFCSGKVYQWNDQVLYNQQYFNHLVNKQYDLHWFDFNMKMGSEAFVQMLKEMDVLLIIGSGNIFKTRQLLNIIEQNKRLIQQQGTAVYLIVNKFDSRTNISPKSMAKKLQLKKVFVVEYDTGIIDACNRHQLIDYVLREIHNKKNMPFLKLQKQLDQIMDEVLRIGKVKCYEQDSQ